MAKKEEIFLGGEAMVSPQTWMPTLDDFGGPERQEFLKKLQTSNFRRNLLLSVLAIVLMVVMASGLATVSFPILSAKKLMRIESTRLEVNCSADSKSKECKHLRDIAMTRKWKK